MFRTENNKIGVAEDGTKILPDRIVTLYADMIMTKLHTVPRRIEPEKRLTERESRQNYLKRSQCRK